MFTCDWWKKLRDYLRKQKRGIRSEIKRIRKTFNNETKDGWIRIRCKSADNSGRKRYLNFSVDFGNASALRTIIFDELKSS